jgi:hypothetical protein
MHSVILVLICVQAVYKLTFVPVVVSWDRIISVITYSFSIPMSKATTYNTMINLTADATNPNDSKIIMINSHQNSNQVIITIIGSTETMTIILSI